MRKCAPATEAGLSTYECMDHQGRLLALWRIASRSLQWKCIHAQEMIYSQEEEREYPDYEGKIEASGLIGRMRLSAHWFFPACRFGAVLAGPPCASFSTP